MVFGGGGGCMGALSRNTKPTEHPSKNKYWVVVLLVVVVVVPVQYWQQEQGIISLCLELEPATLKRHDCRGSGCCTGPQDHMSMRISHSGSKGQHEGEARNHVL